MIQQISLQHSSDIEFTSSHSEINIATAFMLIKIFCNKMSDLAPEYFSDFVTEHFDFVGSGLFQNLSNHLDTDQEIFR